MNPHVEVISSRRLSVFVGILLSYLSCRFVLDGAVSLGDFIINISAGLAVLIGFYFGLLAALVVGVGTILFEVFQGSSIVGSLIEGLLYVFVVYFSYLFWTSDVPGVRGDVKRHLMIALLNSVLVANILAWGHELRQLAPFYISFVYYFLNIVLISLMFVFLHHFYRSFVTNTNELGDRSQETQGSLLFVPVVWTVFAIVGSLGFRLREAVPPSVYVERNIDIIFKLIHPAVFGNGGRRAQAVFGVIMLALIVWIATENRPCYHND